MGVLTKAWKRKPGTVDHLAVDANGEGYRSRAGKGLVMHSETHIKIQAAGAMQLEAKAWLRASPPGPLDVRIGEHIAENLDVGIWQTNLQQGWLQAVRRFVLRRGRIRIGRASTATQDHCKDSGQSNWLPQAGILPYYEAMHMRWTATLVLFGSSLIAGPLDDATRQLARDIFRELIEINTTDSTGSTTVAAQAMATRLLDAGFAPADVTVLGPNDRKGNMVARLHGPAGTALKPILIIGHLDVVEAPRRDWTTHPFQFAQKDGYFYGRGTQDMKVNDAVLVTTLIRFKREGYQPNRDIVLALTADEEGGTSNGVDWLLKNHRNLIDAQVVLNADSVGVL